MASVLFLLLVQAFAETLTKVAWKEAGIKACTVRSVVRSRLGASHGKVREHMPKDILHGTQCLFVYDGTFIFSSRNNLSCEIAVSSTPSLCGAAHWMRDYFL